MSKRIVYPTPDGGVAIIIPILDCGLTLEEIARKDVPKGVPFKIFDVSNLPADRAYRNDLQVDMSVPDGVGVGAQEWFIECYQKEIVDINALPVPADRAAEFNEAKNARLTQLRKLIEVQRLEIPS